MTIDLSQLLSSVAEWVPITATIDTALCVGAGGSTGSLADKPIVRTADKKLLIPASQIKGRLRHECEKLARGLGWPVCDSPKADTMCPQLAGFPESQKTDFHRDDYRLASYPEERQYHCLICQIFGNPTLPSRVLFSDLICDQDPDTLAEVLRPGVTINRDRQTAEDQKLYFLETSPANLQLQFTGQIYFQPGCHQGAKPLILSSLHHINALGGSKSAGLGWLHWDTSGLLQDNDAVWSALLPGGA